MKVIDLLTEQGPLTAAEMAQMLDSSRSSINEQITRLRRNGLIHILRQHKQHNVWVATYAIGPGVDAARTEEPKRKNRKRPVKIDRASLGVWGGLV